MLDQKPRSELDVAQFEAIVLEKYEALVEIIMPASAILDGPLDEFETVLLAGQAALCTAMMGNIEALRLAGFVPDDLGRQLGRDVQSLAKDLRKSLEAAAILQSGAPTHSAMH